MRARSRRCAPDAATIRSRAAIIQACFELDLPPHRIAKLSRHRLLVEDADLLPRQDPRLQFRAWPHAVGADRRQPRQSRVDLSRRFGRRRYRLDRARPVRPLHAARRQHDLYRREQRRLRPDQGAVLGDRRQRLEEEEGRRKQRQRHRYRRHSRCSSARASSRAGFPATRGSSSRSSRRRSSTKARLSST